MKASLFLISAAVCSVMAQGLFGSCNDWWMDDGTEMYADCYTEYGELINMHENLNLCIWNDNGQLKGGNK
jgi:hypothetical protein